MRVREELQVTLPSMTGRPGLGRLAGSAGGERSLAIPSHPPRDGEQAAGPRFGAQKRGQLELSAPRPEIIQSGSTGRARRGSGWSPEAPPCEETKERGGQEERPVRAEGGQTRWSPAAKSGKDTEEEAVSCVRCS